MGFLKYIVATDLEQKRLDKKEFSALKEAIKKAEKEAIKASMKITYNCAEAENFYHMSGKCVVTKTAIADLVNEPGDGIPFLMTRECKHFIKGQFCPVINCPSFLDNHTYNDAMQKLEALRAERRKFWANKFENVK